jgi:hypothetical protein
MNPLNVGLPLMAAGFALVMAIPIVGPLVLAAL